MKQTERILRMLRASGPAGIHTFELRAHYIGNPSQRIADLEAQGHTISHKRERLHGEAVGTRYVLISEAGDDAPAFDDTGAPLLFDAGTGAAPPRGAYDEEAAA